MLKSSQFHGYAERINILCMKTKVQGMKKAKSFMYKNDHFIFYPIVFPGVKIWEEKLNKWSVTLSIAFG